MMWKTNRYAYASALPAIAAALALSSTPALAQSAPAPDSTTAATPAADGTAPAAKPKIKPIIDLSAKPAQTAPAPQPAAAPGPAYSVDETTLMLGGGAIALLALGGGAFALSRRSRRRREEAEWQEAAAQPEARDPLFDEPMFQHEPAMADEQPAIVAPAASAFSWDKAQPCDDPIDDGSDRCPGETWVERAHRGPSPANPSASLKNRLGRAAFFDKRERDVAAGIAAPVDPDAGLPDAMVEEQERELS